MPAALISLNDLLTIPETYQKTFAGEQFLLYDSMIDGPNASSSKDEEGRRPQKRHVVVFTTQEYRVIVRQFGTVRGRCVHNFFVPLHPNIYCHQTVTTCRIISFSCLLLAVRRRARTACQYRINVCVPNKIMTDFECAVINACQQVFPGVPGVQILFSPGSNYLPEDAGCG